MTFKIATDTTKSNRKIIIFKSDLTGKIEAYYNETNRKYGYYKSTFMMHGARAHIDLIAKYIKGSVEDLIFLTEEEFLILEGN